MSLPPYATIVQDLPSTVPFVGPEAQERKRGRLFRARIGANESVFGPSPHAIEAMRQEAAEAWKYCDPENHDLKHALAVKHGVKPENIVVGEGIDGLFGYVVRLFVDPGVTVATSLGAYPTFNFHVAGYGGRLVTTPYVNDREDPDSLLALATREQARLVFLANPDNPMGSWWDGATVQAMIKRLPADCLLCLDEAYCEFAPDGTTPLIDVSNPQVIRFRTFSKAYGMAGARIGYAIGEESVIKSFDKIRNHFGVNRVAQAGALAALADDAHLKWVLEQVAASRDRIAAIARASGLTSLPSATNFVTMDCGRDGAHARRILAELINRDVFVRMPGVPPLDRCIRVSAGTKADVEVFEEMLPEALKAAQ
ncbi:pyridoxal phosphate-dependent aminotransferase [Dongia deserti]|uniref:pyridoxal phosphate-dependent aminotransferase n=1 Tax=Dongia deserti TaxID=2268030 RepID=UPI000E64D2B0|nr:pyridoxal phosphate-dependent aminotransferase [Dongia deserti]